MTMHQKGITAACALLVCSVGLRTDGEPPATDPLRGPAVRDAAGAVRFSFFGSAKLDERPEVMALKNCELSAEDQSAASRELSRRDRILTVFVADELDTLIRIQLADSVGDKAHVLSDVIAGLGRLAERGVSRSLAADLAGVLSERGRGQFERELAGIWRKIASERRGGDASKVTRLDVLLTQLKYGGEALGKDIEAAFQRAERSGELAFAYVFRGLRLSDSQRTRLRSMFLDFYSENGPQPEKSVQDKFFLSVLGFLSEEQREKLLRKFGVIK